MWDNKLKEEKLEERLDYKRMYDVFEGCLGLVRVPKGRMLGGEVLNDAG